MDQTGSCRDGDDCLGRLWLVRATYTALLGVFADEAAGDASLARRVLAAAL